MGADAFGLEPVQREETVALGLAGRADFGVGQALARRQVAALVCVVKDVNQLVWREALNDWVCSKIATPICSP